MTKSITQVNYDELQRISKSLHGESDDIAHIHAATRQKVEALRGGWTGEAARAFFSEQDGKLLPAVQRVSRALNESETVLNQIMTIIRAADEETASYFKGLGAEGGGPAKRTRIYLINGINYDGSEKSFNELKSKIEAQYGPNVEVVVVGDHSYSTNLLQYAPSLSTHFGGWLSPVDWLTGHVSQGVLGAANTVVGVGQVVNEYISGGSVESQKVFEWIQNDMQRNGLIGDGSLNVVLVGHSGGGAIAANIVDDIENKLGVNVSGMVTMGSPISNYDQASRYAEKIADVWHQADLFGTPLGLGTIRSNEMRTGWDNPLLAKFGIPGLIISTFGLDPYLRDSSVNVQNITTTDTGYAWWNPSTWGGAHNSYWNSQGVVDAIGAVL